MANYVKAFSFSPALTNLCCEPNLAAFERFCPGTRGNRSTSGLLLSEAVEPELSSLA